MESKRTIVVSDIHGFPSLLDAALEDAKFNKYGRDRLIVAGDMVDVGAGGLAVIEEAEKLGAEILFGNHEIAAMFGIRIYPQEESSFGLAQMMWMKLVEQSWKFAAESQGFLITHAGLGPFFGPTLTGTEFNPAEVAAAINFGFFKEASEYALSKYVGVTPRALSEFWTDEGPLWFRPDTPDDFATNKQIIGHTPIDYFTPEFVATCAEREIFFTDPYSRKNGKDTLLKKRYFRYVIIENGTATVHTSAD